MYQLFKRLPNTSNACGLQPISQIVREHIVDVSSYLALLAMGDHVRELQLPVVPGGEVLVQVTI
jgi:hypothetical protein